MWTHALFTFLKNLLAIAFCWVPMQFGAALGAGILALVIGVFSKEHGEKIGQASLTGKVTILWAILAVFFVLYNLYQWATLGSLDYYGVNITP